MNANETVKYLKTFIEAIGGNKPNAEQWAKVKSKIENAKLVEETKAKNLELWPTDDDTNPAQE